MTLLLCLVSPGELKTFSKVATSDTTSHERQLNNIHIQSVRVTALQKKKRIAGTNPIAAFQEQHFSITQSHAAFKMRVPFSVSSVVWSQWIGLGNVSIGNSRPHGNGFDILLCWFTVLFKNNLCFKIFMLLAHKPSVKCVSCSPYRHCSMWHI